MLFCLSVSVRDLFPCVKEMIRPNSGRKSSVAGEPVDEAKLAHHGVPRVKGEMTLAFGSFLR